MHPLVHLCKVSTSPPALCVAIGQLSRRLQISRVPAYTQLLELGRARPDAIFLEVGCCCKSSARFLILVRM